MKNKVITSQGNVQFIFPDGKIVNVHPNHIYTAFNEDTVSFILVALPKSSGLALMTSKAEDLELNGETYSFAELPAAMSEAFAIAGAQARCEIVDELPETGYTNTIYLVPQPSPQTGFDEYVYILDQGWELIGDTSIEMENYVTKTVFSGYTASTAAELSGKAEVVEITQANYDLLPSSAKTDASKLYVISDAQPIDLSVYAKTSAVTSADTALDNKIDAVSGATSAALALKQNILTAGTGIDITSDVISVTGSTGGITSGEVQTMIDESISGKADTSSLATVATSGSYDDLTNKPTIPTVPTNVSAFNNDAGYITANDITGKTDVTAFTAHTADTSIHHTSTSAVTSGSTDVVTSGGVYAKMGGMTIVKITESDYQSLSVKGPDTLYVVIPDPQYRWTQSGTTCIGYDKYQNNIKEQSTDGGATWTVVIPEEYSASTLIKVNSQDCGYVPPTAYTYSITIQGLTSNVKVSIDWGGEHTDTNLGNGTYTYTTSSESLSITVPDVYDWHPYDYVNNFTLTSSNNSRTVTYTDLLN